MSMHSVPCWRGLDKVSAPLAGINLAVLLSPPIIVLQTMSVFLDDPARLATDLSSSGAACFGPADSDNPAILSSCGASGIPTPSPSRLTPPILFIERVRTFARSGAHFHTKWRAFSHEVRLFLCQGYSLFGLKYPLKPALMIRVGRPLLGAHFRTKWCALSHEALRIFARSQCVQSLIYQRVFHPRLFDFF